MPLSGHEARRAATAGDPWWRSAAIYHIYLRSFQDTDGDGVGDLDGVASRLDYLVWLGVDAILLSPFHPSPMADFGYDIADHTGVDPLFGTLAGFDRLVAESHIRGLRVILDYVPGHTSAAHPWFAASRSGRNDPKRDWYLWRDPGPGGGPPNNWLSHFGGSAWEFDAPSGQYYLHSFLPEQPDLNWRNPDVRAAMHEVLRFWLRRGVDGFRVDVMSDLVKDAAFRDNPDNPDWREGQAEFLKLRPIHSTNQPEAHALVAGFRRVLDEFPERVLLGEIYQPPEQLAAFYGRDLEEAHLPFNFALLTCEWSAAAVGRAIARYEAALPEGAWPNWVLSNHDSPRVAERVGPAQARVAALLLLALRGTPVLYYGDEIGIGPVVIPAARDPWARREPRAELGRDRARTPMQWEPSEFAGFSGAQPWLPLTEDHAVRNVAIQRDDPGSLLNLVRTLLALRRGHPALGSGSLELLPAEDGLLVYERRASGERLVVALNFTGQPKRLALPDGGQAEILLSTAGRPSEAGVDGTSRPDIALAGDEGLVIRVA